MFLQLLKIVIKMSVELHIYMKTNTYINKLISYWISSNFISHVF